MDKKDIDISSGGNNHIDLTKLGSNAALYNQLKNAAPKCLTCINDKDLPDDIKQLYSKSFFVDKLHKAVSYSLNDISIHFKRIVKGNYVLEFYLNGDEEMCVKVVNDSNPFVTDYDQTIVYTIQLIAKIRTQKNDMSDITINDLIRESLN